MLVYRVEHHETSSGPFQSEFYPDDIDYDSVCPHYWGNYLPVWDDYNDNHYVYQPHMRRWGCHDKRDIKMIDETEGTALAEAGWIVRVYEVPASCVFFCASKKQVVFDFACAVLLLTLDLIQFLLGKEVHYVINPA